MKSRITIDVNEDNQPIIKIEYNSSDDVRDKLVKRFLEAFGGESCWAHFTFLNWASDNKDEINREAKLTPIKPDQLHEQSNLMMLTVTNCLAEHLKI